MWRRRSSTAARSAAHWRASVTSMPVPTTCVTEPSAPVSAVFDHSISRSPPSRVRQWNSVRTGDSPEASVCSAASAITRSSCGTRSSSPLGAATSLAVYPSNCSQALFQRTRVP